MCKSIKPMAQVLLLLLAIHMHILTVGSTTETSASFNNLKHSSLTRNKPSSEIDLSVWRRELRSGGGGGGGGGRGGGGGSGTSGTSSGDCLKQYGLLSGLLFIGILGYVVGVY
ncbi:hypothetical protein N665_0201s0288 [Sinapis alba]|nr:hypothetical protein N665_0201s0288 [Sinapis alba]